MNHTTPRQWIIFFFLAVAWGSSYLWIKLALREITPGRIAALRVCFAAMGLLVLLHGTRRKFPRDRATLAKLTALAVLSIVMPFHLLIWGASQISSVLTGILNGTVPLFTVILAHLFLPGEQMNLLKFLGLCLGMAGSVLLVASGNPHGLAGLTDIGASSSIAGALAILAASSCYAMGAVFARSRLQSVNPITLATTATCIAAALLVLIELTINRHVTPVFPRLPLTWVALVWMGLIGSSAGYVLYFHLLAAWGASRVSFVMYLAPLVAMVLGMLFLGERPGLLLYAGTALVFCGIGVTNIRQRT